MTEISATPSAAPLPGSGFEISQNKWKRPLIATLLSLVAPGLGQFYNHEYKKAVVAGIVPPLIYTTAGHFGGFHSFTSFFLLLALLISWQIGVAVDAFRSAWRQVIQDQLEFRIVHTLRLGAALVVLGPPFLLAFFPSAFNRTLGFHAYKVPSTSNCPTVCEGERMIVDPTAYATNAPKRGDLVMFKHPLFGSLLFKRVVGLPGDIVSHSDDGLLVNGKPGALVDLAHVCGDPPLPSRAGMPMTFKWVSVPPDSLYVVGDNWSDSLDSRFEQFGFVSIKDVRGRPLFLYWSPYKNRIGCPLR